MSDTKKTEPFYTQTLKTHRLWKSMGLCSTQIIILSYRLGIMASSDGEKWNKTDSNVAELFDVSNDTVSRTWAIAIKNGLMPDDGRIRISKGPHECGQGVRTDAADDSRTDAANSRTDADTPPHGCGKDPSILIGETGSLIYLNEHIKEHINKPLNNGNDEFADVYDEFYKNYDKTKETTEVIKTTKVPQNIKIKPEPESHNVIMRKRKVINYSRTKYKTASHTANTDADKKPDYVYVGMAGTDKFIGIPQESYDLSNKEVE